MQSFYLICCRATANSMHRPSLKLLHSCINICSHLAAYSCSCFIVHCPLASDAECGVEESRFIIYSLFISSPHTQGIAVQHPIELFLGIKTALLSLLHTGRVESIALAF